MDPLADLAARWREEAEVLRRCGHDRTARLQERNAEALEDAFCAWWTAELSAAEAAEETRYDVEYLRHLARERKLPAAKAGGEWRFRRCDLPRKPPEGPGLSVVDRIAEDARASRR